VCVETKKSLAVVAVVVVERRARGMDLNSNTLLTYCSLGTTLILGRGLAVVPGIGKKKRK
jgi:hypothetical protein